MRVKISLTKIFPNTRGDFIDQEYSITKHVKGKHLNYTERVFIESRLSDGWSAYRIAKAPGCASNIVRNEIRRSTIELYHGSVKRYKASVDQQQYLQNRLNFRKPLKLFSYETFLAYVVSCFLDPIRHWSLDACFGRALLEGRFDRSEMVCTKTLYRYVSPGLLPVKNIDLPQKLRRKTADTRTRKHRVLFGCSIEKHPSSYADRRHFGHWEIDTVIGRKQGQNPVLLTLTERQTNYTIIRRIACKQADAVMERLSRFGKNTEKRLRRSFVPSSVTTAGSFAGCRNWKKKEPKCSMRIRIRLVSVEATRGITD